MLPHKGLFLNLIETQHSEVGQKIGLASYTDISFCILVKYLLGGSQFCCGPTQILPLHFLFYYMYTIMNYFKHKDRNKS